MEDSEHLDYNSALTNSLWALKVTEVVELQSDPPRPPRRFDMSVEFIKGNLRTLDECMMEEGACCLLYVEKSFLKKIRVGLYFPFSLAVAGLSLMTPDEDTLDVLTNDSGERLEATILPDPSTKHGASRPRQGLDKAPILSVETETEFLKLLEPLLPQGSINKSESL